MRKLFLFVMFFSIGVLKCFSQDSLKNDDFETDHLYIVPSFTFSADLTEQHSFYYDGLFSMMHYRIIIDDLWFRSNYGLGLTVERHYDVVDYNPTIYISWGLEYTFSHLYAFFDVHPCFSIAGNGHQVYGDYVWFYVVPQLGIGSTYKLMDSLEIYAEVGVYKDITIISSRNDLSSSSFGVMLGFGLMYKHL